MSATPLKALVNYAHLYLGQDEAAFVPWTHHRPEHHRLRAQPDPAVVIVPYARVEAADHCRWCDGFVDDTLDRFDLDAPDCGFSWYRMTKAEHQFVNVRHIQHHTGQLADRLRQAAGRGVKWVGGGPPRFGR